MEGLAAFCIRNRVITLTLTVVMLLGGGLAYQTMPRLEDPEFTIKDALVVTPYPGASAVEVEEEVTDRIELAIQQLSQLDEIESKSDRGVSNMTVSILNNYGTEELPQVWDELRRKVSDAQKDLPPGAGPSVVVDDYGDVFGVFFVVYGAEYSFAELKDYVDLLRRELVLVQDVARVETFGERPEVIYVEPVRDRISQLGISPAEIASRLIEKNVAVYAGRVQVGSEFISIIPTGEIGSVEEFGDILISGDSRGQIYLRDVANVRRGYQDPPTHLIFYDGNPAIGIGISTVSGGNVVTMGAAASRRLLELADRTPLGLEAGIVSHQSQAVTVAISGFRNSLIQAVAIVVVVLLVFMGVRSGMLIGFVLVLTIAGSFIFLKPWGVALERISLGALIIALGMLVDNAIVVVDGVLVRLQRGEDAIDAALAVVRQTAIPLLGATVIAVLAFAAIGTSPDSTGEFCRSLFQVVLVSLMLSWVTAITVTPLLCVMFLKAPSSGEEVVDPYAGSFYQGYRGLLSACIRLRFLTTAVVIGIFGFAVWGFGYVDRSFFPPSTRPQFLVDLWLPQGTHISRTQETALEVAEYMRKLDGVGHTSSLIGQGGLRFLLTYSPEKQNSAYAQILVDVDDATVIDRLAPGLEAYLDVAYPDVTSFVSKFELGPGANGKVRARLTGPDPNVLRALSDEVLEILETDGNAKGIRSDWGSRVLTTRPMIADEQADLNGIERPDIAAALLANFEGLTTGVYRERDLLLPIVIRAPEDERNDVEQMQNIQIWSPVAGRMIPLQQVTLGEEQSYEDAIIYRRDRKRTLTVFADPKTGPATVLFNRVRPKVEALDYPPGYAVEWGGEYEDSAKAQGPLFAVIPYFVVAMFLITVILFNSLRKPLVIWLCVPLALIGVTAGLLLASQPFGFMALLGFLSLMGMLIKNAIVLVDQISLEIDEGQELLPAIVEAGVSRLRPVAMAAATTALGMVPLLLDAFFIAMAVTIIGGLLFATVLTMVIVPTLYAMFFGAPVE
jgi:multidrug efflux pump subunit AcrB